jgi:tetratricopeptide (TPR) repeat protein
MLTSLTVLAKQQRMKGQFQEALNTLAQAITRNPRDEQAYYERATLYMVMGLASRSIQDFKRLSALRPDQKDYVDKWLVKLGRRTDEPEIGEIVQMLTQFAYKTCGPNRLDFENDKPTWQVYSENISVFNQQGFVKASVRAIFDFCPTPQMLLTIEPDNDEYIAKFLLGITVKNIEPPHSPFAELDTLIIAGKLDALEQKLSSLLSEGILKREDRFFRYPKFTGDIKSVRTNPMSVITY